MNTQKFIELARTTGANKCIQFEFTCKLKNSCARDYIEKGILQPCVVLKGGKCEVLTRR